MNGQRENILPESQAGFREKRSTFDNIFILNTAIQAHISKKGGKLYVLFVDLKSAFTSVSHDLLWRKLFKKGVSSKLIRILNDIYSKATVQV